MLGKDKALVQLTSLSVGDGDLGWGLGLVQLLDGQTLQRLGDVYGLK